MNIFRNIENFCSRDESESILDSILEQIQNDLEHSTENLGALDDQYAAANDQHESAAREYWDMRPWNTESTAAPEDLSRTEQMYNDTLHYKYTVLHQLYAAQIMNALILENLCEIGRYRDFHVNCAPIGES